MRVTFCAYDLPNYINGPNVWLARLSRALVQRGHAVHVLLIFQGSLGPTFRALEEVGVKLSTIEWPHFTEDRIRWIIRRLAESPPDVFVPNLSVPGYFAGKWVRLAGVPTVGILHSDDDFYRGLIDEFVVGPKPFRVSAVVGVSSFLVQALENAGCDDVRKLGIPYGVEIPDRTAAWEESRFRVVYAGRLVEPQKRIQEVAESICRCASQVEGVEGRLYGEGPERPNLERLLSTWRLPQVQLGGRLENSDLLEAFLACQAILLLSEFEGMPIALLEAMAHGVVPICLRTRSGIPELVVHGETGLVVENRREAVVEAVRLLRSDQPLWTRLSRAARERVRLEFSVDAMVDQWMQLFDDLTRGGRKAPAGIVAPRRFELPRVHPALSREDNRRPAFWRWLFGAALRASARAYRSARSRLGV